MNKRLQIKLLTLAFLLLFNFKTKGQTYLVSKTEIVGTYDGWSYLFQTDLKGFMLVRTDEQGALAWMSPMKTFDADSSSLYLNESRFIVAGTTSFNRKANKIKGTPSDYEYWLVPFDQVSPGFFCMPNPTYGQVKVIVDENSDLENLLIYDAAGKVVDMIQLQERTLIELEFDKYEQGLYLIEGKNSRGVSVQTIKIIKL